MKTLIKWGRSKKGCVESKCGKYDIVPVPIAAAHANGYECWRLVSGRIGVFKTQVECKEAVEIFECFRVEPE